MIKHYNTSAEIKKLYKDWQKDWNKKYNCKGPPTLKSQRVGYQHNQIILHHYQHSKNQRNS